MVGFLHSQLYITFMDSKGHVISVASAWSIFLDRSRLRKVQVWRCVFVASLTYEQS